MTYPKLTIETDRLLIRPFKRSDIDAAYEMNLDPEVSRYTGDGGVLSKEELQRRIEENVLGDYEKHGFGRLAVDLKGVDNCIGFTGLKFIPDLGMVDLGYRFKRQYWGQGIATESGKACIKLGFETLDLAQIVGFVLPGNLASIRVLEKLGFAYQCEMYAEGLLVNQYVLQRQL